MPLIVISLGQPFRPRIEKPCNAPAVQAYGKISFGPENAAFSICYRILARGGCLGYRNSEDGRQRC